MLTSHLRQSAPVYINNSIWEDLSDGQREIVQTSADDAAEEEIETVPQEEEDLLGRMQEEGMEVVRPQPDGCLDSDDFREHVLSAVTEEFPEWEEDIQTLIDLG